MQNGLLFCSWYSWCLTQGLVGAKQIFPECEDRQHQTETNSKRSWRHGPGSMVTGVIENNQNAMILQWSPYNVTFNDNYFQRRKESQQDPNFWKEVGEQSPAKIITKVAGQQLEEMECEEGEELEFEQEIVVDMETESTKEMYDEDSNKRISTRAQQREIETAERQQAQQQRQWNIENDMTSSDQQREYQRLPGIQDVWEQVIAAENFEAEKQAAELQWSVFMGEIDPSTVQRNLQSSG